MSKAKKPQPGKQTYQNDLASLKSNAQAPPKNNNYPQDQTPNQAQQNQPDNGRYYQESPERNSQNSRSPSPDEPEMNAQHYNDKSKKGSPNQSSPQNGKSMQRSPNPDEEHDDELDQEHNNSRSGSQSPEHHEDEDDGHYQDQKANPNQKHPNPAVQTKPPRAEGEIPTNKDELIDFLKEKLGKAETTMSTILTAIQIEREKKDNMRAELNQRKQAIDEHNEQEGSHLGGKVEEKMKPSIQRAIEDRVLAENEKAQLEEDLKELDIAIQEVDEGVRTFHAEKCRKEVEIDEAQYRINEQEVIIDGLNKDNTLLTSQNERRDKEIHELEVEIDEMNGVMEMLFDVRVKLNKYHEIEIQNTKPDSRQSVQTPKNLKAGGLGTVEGDFEFTRKPNFVKEDDFWYAEAEGRHLNDPKKAKNDVPSWQPKVQDLNNEKRERPKGEFRTVEYKPPTPPLRLPNINNARPEYIYKNQEFIDEFGNMSPSKKKPAQMKKRL